MPLPKLQEGVAHLAMRFMRLFFCIIYKRFSIAEKNEKGEAGAILIEGIKTYETNIRIVGIMIALFDHAEEKRHIQKLRHFPAGGIPKEMGQQSQLGEGELKTRAMKVVIMLLYESGCCIGTQVGASGYFEQWWLEMHPSEVRTEDSPPNDIPEDILSASKWARALGLLVADETKYLNLCAVEHFDGGTNKVYKSISSALESKEPVKSIPESGASSAGGRGGGGGGSGGGSGAGGGDVDDSGGGSQRHRQFGAVKGSAAVIGGAWALGGGISDASGLITTFDFGNSNSVMVVAPLDDKGEPFPEISWKRVERKTELYWDTQKHVFLVNNFNNQASLKNCVVIPLLKKMQVEHTKLKQLIDGDPRLSTIFGNSLRQENGVSEVQLPGDGPFISNVEMATVFLQQNFIEGFENLPNDWAEGTLRPFDDPCVRKIISIPTNMGPAFQACIETAWALTSPNSIFEYIPEALTSALACLYNGNLTVTKAGAAQTFNAVVDIGQETTDVVIFSQAEKAIEVLAYTSVADRGGAAYDEMLLECIAEKVGDKLMDNGVNWKHCALMSQEGTPTWAKKTCLTLIHFSVGSDECATRVLLLKSAEDLKIGVQKDCKGTWDRSACNATRDRDGIKDFIAKNSLAYFELPPGSADKLPEEMLGVAKRYSGRDARLPESNRTGLLYFSGDKFGITVSATAISNLVKRKYLRAIQDEIVRKLRFLIENGKVPQGTRLLVTCVGGGSKVLDLVNWVPGPGLLGPEEFIYDGKVGFDADVAYGAVYYAVGTRWSFVDTSSFFVGTEYTPSDRPLKAGKSLSGYFWPWLSIGQQVPARTALSADMKVSGKSDYNLYQFASEPPSTKDGCFKMSNLAVLIGKVILDVQPDKEVTVIFVSAELGHGLPRPKFTYDSHDGPSVFDYEVRFYIFSRNEMVNRRSNVQRLGVYAELDHDLGKGSVSDAESDDCEPEVGKRGAKRGAKQGAKKHRKK